MHSSLAGSVAGTAARLVRGVAPRAGVRPCVCARVCAAHARIWRQPLGAVRFLSAKKKSGAKAPPAVANNASSKPSSSSPAAAGGARAGASRGGAAPTHTSQADAASAAAASAAAAAAGNGIDGDVVFSVQNLGKTLPGGRVLLKDVTLAFQRGAKIGVLGLNGAGKSTLLKILSGVDAEYDGKVWRSDGLQFGYLAQEPVLDASKSVHANVMDGLKEKTDLLERYEAIASEMAHPDADMDCLMQEQADVQAKIDHFDCWTLAHTVEIAKQALRVPPDDADVNKLSGGERRRVALCRLLLEAPDVLLLDEPTNHLDATSVAWLETFLKSYKGTVLAITHDRYFLDLVAGWILEIDRGAAYPYQGNYSLWLQKKSERLDTEKKHERKKAKAMEQELAWIRQGARGRQTKSKARVQAYERLVTEREAQRSQEKFLSGAIVIPPAPRLGDQVIQLEGVRKMYGDRVLLHDISFDVPPGAIVGIIGGNGTGKTTLLKLITGELAPDAGRIRVGKSVKIGVVSQSRSELIDNQRVIDVVGGGSDLVSIGDYEMPIRQYLASFNLVGELQTKLVKSLSGGERNRVHLARVLKTGANVLMLDEPTNDLDVDTLRSLEEALEEYTGCALVVSHDRYFLDRVATHILSFNGDGTVRWFEGGYAEFEEDAAATRVST